jgi:hypothetical protein
MFMALVVRRSLGAVWRPKHATLAFFAVFAVANAMAPLYWRRTECVVLVVSFLAGAWTLRRQAREAQQESLEAEPLEFKVADEAVLTV